MERKQKTIAERLYNNLPADLEFIDPQWLGGFGIPGFLVERINFILHKKLLDSVETPTTDWADMDAKSVRAAWSHFIEAIEAEKRLPFVHAKSVIDAAVGDLLHILVEPRKNLPDFLFGSDETLDFREASERAEMIVVYSHFGHHLPNYMRRKQLDYIDRDRFSSFISQLDDKLTAQYNALNWAQLLTPLFELNEQLVDPELLERFFRDKNRNQLAELFNGQTQKLDQTRFIEILSAPLADQDTESDPTPSAGISTNTEKVEVDPTSKPAASDETTHVEAHHTEPHSEYDIEPDNEPDAEAEADTEPVKEENTTGQTISSDTKIPGATATVPPATESSDRSAEPVKPVTPAPEPDSEPAPLWQQFRQEKQNETVPEKETRREEPDVRQASEPERGDIRPEFVTPPDTAPAPTTATGPEKETEPEQKQEQKQEPKSRAKHFEDLPLVERYKTEESGKTQSDDGDSTRNEKSVNDTSEQPDAEPLPMWKRFISAATSVKIPELGKSDKSKILADSLSPPEDDYELDIEISNPLRIDEIKKTLDDKKKYYIKRFFKGDHAAFNTVIRDLAEMETWKEAGPYITKNVFKKNKIDPYSDEAVNFVDRLQSYFNAYHK